MKKLFISLLLTLSFLPAIAGTKLVSGDLGVLYGTKQVPVMLNWDNAIFGKNGTLDDFLSKAYRSETWESQSLGYFIKEVNKKITEYGTKVLSDNGENAGPYIIEITVNSISKGGDIKGYIYMKDIESNSNVATVEFSSDESDNDDEIAFRDQLENIGGNYGKMLEKALKKAYKQSK